MEKPCEKVLKENSHLNELKTQRRIPTIEKPYECHYCEKKFSIKDHFTSHVRWHTDENPYHCNHCEKSFKTTRDLKCHKVLHKGEKLYECTHCSMTFSDNEGRLNHLKTSHTGEKPYKCKECGKTFKRNALLREHHRVHTGEKPYQCESCEKSFRTKRYLTEHMNKHNVDLKTHHPTLKKDKKKHSKQRTSTQSKISSKANQENILSNSVSQKSIHINHLITHSNSYGLWLGRVKQSHMKNIDSSKNQITKSKDKNISNKISISDQSSIPLFCDDFTKVTLWFQQNKLLKSAWSCDICCNLMNWSETEMSKDGFEWKCQTKDCMKYEQSMCIKSDSFFHNSSVTLPDWFDIMYLWSENVKAEVTSDLADVNHTQIMDCYSSFREVCWAYFIENPIKLGGPETIIEIDVTKFMKFSGNSKTNDDKPIMVLGIIESNNPLKGYMEIVETSDAATLLPKLLNVIKPGSIIYTKNSKEYLKLQGIAGIMDTIANHSVKFLDINTSDHVTNMESFWEKHSSNINDIHEYKPIDQNSYLQEFMWRDCFYDDSFHSLCQQISDQYPC